MKAEVTKISISKKIKTCIEPSLPKGSHVTPLLVIYTPSVYIHSMKNKLWANETWTLLVCSKFISQFSTQPVETIKKI